jgi:predicted Zn-dependent protease
MGPRGIHVPLKRLAGFFSLLLGGCMATSYNVATEQQETLFISTEREIALGASVAKRVEEEFPVVRDPELLQRLDRVSARIAAVADRKDLSYRFSIVEMPEQDEPNAFALPGGPVYATRALFELAKSDDELAAVLAHEVGHVVAKHTVKRLQGVIGLQLLQILAAGTGAADARTHRGMDLAFASLMLEYSQTDELQADRLSAKYLRLAGYDPKAAVTFMERLRDYTFKQPMRRHSYFRSHPYFSDRIRLLRQESQGTITFDDYINQKE